MQTFLIQSAKVIDPTAEHHNKTVDILIKNGKIEHIAPSGTLQVADATLIDGKGQLIAPGFFDLNVNFGEPGLETKEDMSSGCAAAAAGGFTGVALQPNTLPALQSRSEISFILNSSKNELVEVHPIGAISKDRKGEFLAELYDMKTSGAIAFSDGNHSLQQASLMSRALLYCKGFDGLIFSFAEDKSLSGNTMMNEGVTSTYLGMKGNPSLAEEVMVARDLFLAEYNESRIHFSTISTQGSVKLIREAKSKGIQVSCDVAAHHLVETDESIMSFDSNYKVRPPLRIENDRLALLEGIADGTIDAIVSQHTPHEIEFKNVEFEKASFGIIGLQTVLPLVLKAGLALETIVEKLAINPRKILGIKQASIRLGEEANLILFNPEENWIFDKESNGSKADNSPYFNTELTGKVNLLINRNQYYRS